MHSRLKAVSDNWGLLGAALVLASSLVAQAAEPNPSVVLASARVAVVHTESGNVQGFARDGIYTWRGIPYATAERFKAPHRVKPWDGTRMALSFGNICPQPVNPQLSEPQTFISDTRFWPASEECQNLNIWSPGPDVAKHRPVLVWLHGGGFFSGSSMELPIYDGTNLSRKGDVVVVSVNHRLNVLGFLDLSAYGADYRQSANVGMLDLIEALRWVHDNIGQFGGDPANVTIFGQSGGGAKVATLMASPRAKGLFHKAIIQSGAPGTMPAGYSNPATARKVAELTLRETGLGEGQVGALASLPYERLITAANRALDIAGREGTAAPLPAGRFGLS